MYGQSSLRIQHINYFNHVLELFKPYLSKDFELKTKSFVDKSTKNSYSSVNFATLSLPCFNYYKNLFYNSDNLKIVTSNIQDLLTPSRGREAAALCGLLSFCFLLFLCFF